MERRRTVMRGASWVADRYTISRDDITRQHGVPGHRGSLHNGNAFRNEEKNPHLTTILFRWLTVAERDSTSAGRPIAPIAHACLPIIAATVRNTTSPRTSKRANA